MLKDNENIFLFMLGNMLIFVTIDWGFLKYCNDVNDLLVYIDRILYRIDSLGSLA